MKREPKPEFDSYKIFPVFDWPQCCMCQNTFGFEIGYEMSFPVRRTVCKKCCIDQKGADEILEKRKKNSRPKFPPSASPRLQSPRQVAIQTRLKDIKETNDNNYIIRKEIKCDKSYLP